MYLHSTEIQQALALFVKSFVVHFYSTCNEVWDEFRPSALNIIQYLRFYLIAARSFRNSLKCGNLGIEHSLI